MHIFPFLFCYLSPILTIFIYFICPLYNIQKGPSSVLLVDKYICMYPYVTSYMRILNYLNVKLNCFQHCNIFSRLHYSEIASRYAKTYVKSLDEFSRTCSDVGAGWVRRRCLKRIHWTTQVIIAQLVSHSVLNSRSKLSQNGIHQLHN